LAYRSCPKCGFQRRSPKKGPSPYDRSGSFLPVDRPVPARRRGDP
jgi:hypothetical protein